MIWDGKPFSSLGVGEYFDTEERSSPTRKRPQLEKFALKQNLKEEKLSKIENFASIGGPPAHEIIGFDNLFGQKDYRNLWFFGQKFVIKH